MSWVVIWAKCLFKMKRGSNISLQALGKMNPHSFQTGWIPCALKPHPMAASTKGASYVSAHEFIPKSLWIHAPSTTSTPTTPWASSTKLCKIPCVSILGTVFKSLINILNLKLFFTLLDFFCFYKWFCFLSAIIKWWWAGELFLLWAGELFLFLPGVWRSQPGDGDLFLHCILPDLRQVLQTLSEISRVYIFWVGGWFICLVFLNLENLVSWLHF